VKQPDETHLAGGMADGTLSIRRRQYKPEEADVTFNLTNFIGYGTTKTNRIEHKPFWDKDELRIESRRMKRLKEYDKLLKAFKYSAALDSVLRKVSFVL
jgi:U3 small nucleolar RNA-associated protein 15